MTEYCQKKFKVRVMDPRTETRPNLDRKYLTNLGLDGLGPDSFEVFGPDQTRTKNKIESFGPDQDRTKLRNPGLDLTRTKSF